MNFRYYCLSILLLATLSASSLSAQPVAGVSPKISKYLADYRIALQQDLLAGSVTGISAYLSDSARLLPEYQLSLIGKEQVSAYYTAFAARFKIGSYQCSVIEVMDLGGRIMESGEFTMQLILRGTGQTEDVAGRYLSLWKKKPDGNLELFTEAWNYSRPVKMASELIFDKIPSVNISFRPHLPFEGNTIIELAALNSLMEKVITWHDAATWKQFYAADAKLYYSNHPAFHGRAAIDSFLEDHVKHLPVFEKLDIRNDRVDNFGEFIIEYASHVAIIRSGNWSGVNTGKDIRIWRRQQDHSLKIFRGIAVYD